MKLNPDCIRDILLHVEDHSNYETRVTTNSMSFSMKKYSIEEIAYTVERLYEAGYLDVTRISSISSHCPGFIIKSITYPGHIFLDNIRIESVWKKVLAKGAGASLPIIAELAKELAMKHFLG